MEKKLTAELKALKEEFDFIHKKIGDLEWERAIIAILLISANSRCVEPPFAIIRTYCF